MTGNARRVGFWFAVPLVVGLLGWYGWHRAQRDARAVRAIEALGGTVRQGSYGRAVDLCFREITDKDFLLLADLTGIDELDLRYNQKCCGRPELNRGRIAYISS